MIFAIWIDWQCRQDHTASWQRCYSRESTLHADNQREKDVIFQIRKYLFARIIHARCESHTWTGFKNIKSNTTYKCCYAHEQMRRISVLIISSLNSLKQPHWQLEQTNCLFVCDITYHCTINRANNACCFVLESALQ